MESTVLNANAQASYLIWFDLPLNTVDHSLLFEQIFVF